MDGTLELRVYQGDLCVQTLAIDETIIKIGSSDICQLQLDGLHRMHAVLERDAQGRHRVMDLGGGLIVDNQSCASHDLALEESFELGDYQIVFGEQRASITIDESLLSEQAPYVSQTYLDEDGNSIPYYYDEQGDLLYGWGWYDESGCWQLSQGYWDVQGEWVSTCIDDASPQLGVSDSEVYTDAFLHDSSGDRLEVALMWHDHLLSVECYRGGESIEIGPTKGCDYVIEHDSLQGATPLIKWHQEQWMLCLAPGFEATVQLDGELYDRAQLENSGLARRFEGGIALPFDPGCGARVDVGPNTFLLRYIDGAGMPKGVGNFDRDAAPYVALSALAHVLLLLLAMGMPGDASSMELDPFSPQDRFVNLTMDADEEENDEPTLDAVGAEESAQAHKGESGEAGKKDSPETDGSMGLKGPKDQDIELRHAEDLQTAREAGALAVLDTVSSPFGTGTQTIGQDAIHALGHLDEAGIGEAAGEQGLGVRGTGIGGPNGNSDKSIGLMDGITTIGNRPGTDNGRLKDGGGNAKLDCPECGQRQPEVVPGPVALEGSLDRELIRRVVRQHRNELKYCYEQQLQKNPRLAGTVTMKWTITGQGRVIAPMIAKSTLGNRKVESCLKRKIARWQFPEPKNGGLVKINKYPFRFSR